VASDRMAEVVSSPLRTCVGCRERGPRSNLVRLVLDINAQTARVSVDPTASQGGRGAWIHCTERCIRQAIRRKPWVRVFRYCGGVDTNCLEELAAAAGPDKRAASQAGPAGQETRLEQHDRINPSEAGGKNMDAR
jgi:predicted RNA-binding protein YlxR (DUF448 family)